MKIAFMIGDFPSLSETFILNQITSLIDQNHEVDIYATPPEKLSTVHSDISKYELLRHTYYYPTMPVNYAQRMWKAFVLILRNLISDPNLIVRSLNFFRYGKQALSLRLLYAVIPFLNRRPIYDVIHCHFGHIGILGMQLKEIGAIQGSLYTTFHAWDITEYLQKTNIDIYKNLFLSGKKFLPISQYWRHRLIELGCNPKKIVVHRMGIECQKFPFSIRKPHDQNQVQIVTVARLVEKKGIEFGIRAIAHLKQQNFNFKYIIIGDGVLRNSLEQLIIELQVKNYVEILGWKSQSDVINTLNQSHMLLAPSITGCNGDQEGIPVALMEALAMGLPVISTNYSGIPELVKDGVSGFLVPERDPRAIAEKISYLLSHPELWETMGRAGRNHVINHYEISQLAQEMMTIYADHGH